MRKVRQILLTGTMLSAVVSITSIDPAKADPLRLAAAACPQGQVGTPPDCKPAPPQKPNPPPAQQHAPPPAQQHAAPPPPQHAAPPQPQQHAAPPQPPQHATPPQPQQHAAPPQPQPPQQHAAPPPPQQHTAPPQPQPQQHAAPPQPQQHVVPAPQEQHAAPPQPQPQPQLHAAPPQPQPHAAPAPQEQHAAPPQQHATPPQPQPQQQHAAPSQPQPQPHAPPPPQNAQQPQTPQQKQQQIIEQLQHKPPQPAQAQPPQPAPPAPVKPPVPPQQPAQAQPPQHAAPPQPHAAPQPQNAQQPLTPQQKQQQIIEQLQHKPPQPAQAQPQQPTPPAPVKPPVPPQQPAQAQPQQAPVKPPVPPQQPAQTQPQQPVPPASVKPPQPQQPAQVQPQQPGTPASAATQPRNAPSAAVAAPWCNPRPGTMGCSLPPWMQKPIQPTRKGPPAIVVITDNGEVTTIDQLHKNRSETHEGDFTVIHEPDRTIWVDKKGQIFIQHDDTGRFRYGARDVRVDRRGDDTVSTIWLPNGERVVTTFDPRGRMLRRSRFLPNGREIVLIDQRPESLDYDYVVTLPPPTVRIPRDRYIVDAAVASEQTIYDALMAAPVDQLERAYSLDEVRQSVTVRERMPSVDVDTINFDLGSWEVEAGQVGHLSAIAEALKRALTANPQEIFLIEGHTDAVGNDVDNMSLSDRRAETVALILSQRYAVPAENLVTQGYGKQFPAVQSAGPERRNRRVTVRRITPLLAGPQ